MKPKVHYVRHEVGTLVCFALEEEAGPFRRLAARMPDVTVLITGIGAKNAETAVRRFLSEHLTKRVFTCGFAGGLTPELQAGDVVYMTGYPALEEKLVEADATLATYISVPHIVTTVAEKKQLRVKTGADVVEMESEVILAVCREKKIPCAMVRAISDTANEDLPLDFNQLSKPDMSLHYGKLARAVARSPLKIGALVRLHRKTSYAAQQLANVLAKAVW
jgi:adenosylhomocysteine nucleosidase